MKKKPLLIGLILALCIGVGVYIYLNPDLSEYSYKDIEAYRAQHPHKTVHYTVTIHGDEAPLEVTERDTELLCTLAQTDSLIAHAEYLQHLTKISFPDDVMDTAHYLALRSAFPQAELVYESIRLLGDSYPADATEVTLPPLTDDQFKQAATDLLALQKLQEVTVTSHEETVYTTENAAVLAAALPDVTVHLTFDLFGQTVSTDMDRIEYFKADIGGDAGLDVIRNVMPIMDKLTYLRLDWCNTTNEATAALREELSAQCKVVWRVFFGDFNCLTDTYKIWAQYYLWTRDLGPLQYCNEVRYIDMGHSYIDSCEFVKYMPYLDTLILADCSLRSLEPLRTCKNLTYLEIFTTNVVDLSPLADLTQLEYLNISNVETRDISPLYGLTNLKKMNSTMNEKIPRDQIEEFKRRLPDCDATFTFADESPTEYGWRRAPAPPHGIYLYTPRYALLRQQIGYDTKDYSRYPKGYLTEEVTYESTGILPPEEYYKEENYE